MTYATAGDDDDNDDDDCNVFQEGFEGTFPPTGWTVTDNLGYTNQWQRSDYWSFYGGNNNTYGSGYAAAADSGSAYYQNQT